jgi:hypothetical protein
LVGLLGWGISSLQGHYLHRARQTQKKHRHASMCVVGFEPTIPVFKQEKLFRGLDHTATVIGLFYLY